MRRFTHHETLIAVLATLLLACGSADESGASNAGGSGGATGTSNAGSGSAGTAGSSVLPDGGVKEGEVCNNGLDDDGNGQVDEDCPCYVEEQGCYPGPADQLGKGLCTLGVQKCILDGEFGTWGPCEGATLPGVDNTCNGVDEDCNGVVDDLCECLPGEYGSCGVVDPPCTPGTRECQADGTWGDCFGGIQPETEVCDAFDNDCDGEVDEGCECVPGSTAKCGTDEGLCAFGDKFCQPDGTWSDCLGGIQPAQEVCNGADDDCNGLVDDLPNCACTPGTQTDCGLQIGECEPGIQVCQAGGVWSDCLGAVPPGTEVCNGKDDDCDGLTDPGCQCIIGETIPCAGTDEGACQKGTHACRPDGTWSDCQGAVLPQTEICGNNIDEDCDGQLDNGCPTTVTVNLNIDGDCVTASCPSNAPFPVGCNVTFSGGDSRGCVASSPGSPVVYFQEGDQCGAGHLSGTLSCSSQQGNGLNASNCPINKSDRYYPSSSSGCPETNG